MEELQKNGDYVDIGGHYLHYYKSDEMSAEIRNLISNSCVPYPVADSVPK